MGFERRGSREGRKVRAERKKASYDRAPNGAGVAQDTFLAAAWAGVRTLRLADGPDEVHLEAIAKQELRKWAKAPSRSAPN